MIHLAPDGNGSGEVLWGISCLCVFDERNRFRPYPGFYSTPKVYSLTAGFGLSLLSFLHFHLLNQYFVPTRFVSSLGGRSSCSRRGSVDAGGEEWLLEPAGIEHLCCLGVYPGGGWQSGGGDGIPGLLRCHQGAEELPVFGEMWNCPASAHVNIWSFKDVLKDRNYVCNWVTQMIPSNN